MIAVEVRYSATDYLRVRRFLSGRFTKTFMVVCWVGLIILTLWFYRAEPTALPWWVVPATAGLVVWLFFVMRFMQGANINRQLKGIPGVDESYVYTFSEEGIAIAGRLSSTNIKWEAIVKARESKNDFFFYTTKHFAQFLPKHFLGHNGEIELRALLHQKLGNKAQLLA